MCSVVVYAGDADARVRFDGHQVALHSGDVVRFTVVWNLGRTDKTCAFLSVSDSGVVMDRELGPNLYIAELSGRGVVWWRQLPYDAKRQSRHDARRSGEVRGAVEYVSANLSDRMFPRVRTRRSASKSAGTEKPGRVTIAAATRAETRPVHKANPTSAARPCARAAC